MTKEERLEVENRITLYDKLIEGISPQLKLIDIIKQKILDKDFDDNCKHPAIRLNVNVNQYSIALWTKEDSADVRIEGKATSSLLKEISKVILKFLEERTAKITEQINNI